MVFSSVLLVSETPKDASSEKELMKRAHDLSASPNTVFSNSREIFHLPPPVYPEALNLPTWLSVINGTGNFHLLGNSQNKTAVFSQKI